jgi:hypothetical protein
MELFLDTKLVVPLFQVALLLVFSTVALLFGRMKLALIINYCFTLYWGFFLNVDFFSDKGDLVFNSYSFAYFGFGLLIVALAVIGLLSKE